MIASFNVSGQTRIVPLSKESLAPLSSAVNRYSFCRSSGQTETQTEVSDRPATAVAVNVLQ